MNILKYIVAGVLLAFGFSSCKVARTPRKVISITPYFQDSTVALPTTMEIRQPQVSRIQKEDLLGITVSSLNKESNDLLNFSNVNSLSMSALPGGGGGGSQPIGYPVDSSDNISMAFIGKVNVAGLALEAAQERIRAALDGFVKDPAVNIRFMNHKFVVFGEVNQGGAFSLFDDRTTIIDALATAGDLTPFANRDSIMIIRSINGPREIA
ncbi:polysaccharide biosynthesis/export family protein [Persicitalea sp.]|uniref:polysaccharide biosynthesis/export family protein n=1 Tax=Persicitalea sp. TaxID=3100273 RepID=UPI003593412E